MSVHPLRRERRLEDPVAYVRQKRERVLTKLNTRGNKKVVERTTRLNELLIRGGANADAAAKLRLAGLKRIRHADGLDADQERDLLLIVFSIGLVSNGARVQAGSMLALYGSKESVDEIHDAFPGLMPAINAAAI